MGPLLGIDPTRTFTSAQLVRGDSGGPVGISGYDRNGLKYKLVLFDNGVGNVAAVAGNAAYYLAVSGASAGQYTTVTMDLTDCAGLQAGVFMSVPADGEYCWIQTRGPCTMTTALTAGADGNALTAVGAGADGVLDVSAAVTDAVTAFAVDASAKIVLLMCPD